MKHDNVNSWADKHRRQKKTRSVIELFKWNELIWLKYQKSENEQKEEEKKRIDQRKRSH